MRLTDISVRSLKLPGSGRETGGVKQKTFFDDNLKGFGVRVSVGGSKTFVLMYGKKRQLRTLGHYPEMSLAEARIAAKRVQGEVAGPIDAPPSQIGLLPFTTVRSQFLRDTATRTKTSTLSECRRLLEKHFTFDKPVGAVTRQDITSVIAEMGDRPGAAKHAFIAIRTMMNWAVRHGHLAATPVPPLKFKSPSRTRVLADDELAAVWRRAEEIGYPYGTLVQLLILTGQRRGEIAGLRRAWVKDGTITFPVGFCKNKREHVVPLSPLAQEIMTTVPGNDALLFPARGASSNPFSGWSKAKREFDRPLSLAPYTLHDLRRTFASQLAALGTPIHVTEKLLNHISGSLSGVAAIYNRYTYAPEMKAAAEAYEAHLRRLLDRNLPSAANV